MLPDDDPRYDEVVTFGDAHSGIGVASMQLPLEYKQAADKLEGQTMSIREAIERIESAGTSGAKVEVIWQYGYFLLKLPLANHEEQCWRLINYEHPAP